MSMRPSVFLGIWSLILCWSGAGAFAEEADKTYLLQYKFQDGEYVRYYVDHWSTITTQFGGAEETATNRSETGKHFRVLAVKEDGSAIVELVLDWVNMKVQFGDAPPTVYDSRKGDVPAPQLQSVADKLGKPTARAEFAPNGELREIVMLDSENKESKPTAESDSSGVGNLLVILPETPIAVGHKWHDDYEVFVMLQGTRSVRRPIKMRRTYELTKVDGDIATLALRTSIVTLVRDPNIRGQLVQRTPRGTITFDLKRGQIVSRKHSIDGVEVGVFGPKSSIKASSRYTEKRVESKDVAANKK